MPLEYSWICRGITKQVFTRLFLRQTLASSHLQRTIEHLAHVRVIYGARKPGLGRGEAELRTTSLTYLANLRVTMVEELHELRYHHIGQPQVCLGGKASKSCHIPPPVRKASSLDLCRQVQPRSCPGWKIGISLRASLIGLGFQKSCIFGN